MLEAFPGLLTKLVKFLAEIGPSLTGVAAIISALYLWRIHRKRIKASIDIVHRYIKIEKECYSTEELKAHKEIVGYIENGHQNSLNYSPIVFYSKGYQPSFEQISEICYHLEEDERYHVLRHFFQVFELEEYSNRINSDYFRCISQARKKIIYENFRKLITENMESVEKVDAILNERGKRVKITTRVKICTILLVAVVVMVVAIG